MRWQDVYAKFGSDRQSGFGLHDSPNKYLNPPNVTNHARTMKRYGIDNYKILADADNKKAGRVQIYRQHGIHSIVRTHVDRPTPNFVIDLQVARDYVNAGAWAIEPMNEPNLRDEWKDGTFPSSWVEYGKIVARQWMRNADVILSAGGVPVTPALSPGGHVPHREATLRFLDGINFHGGRAQLDRAVIGVHWRPLNNPIDTLPGIGNPPNTTLWRENEWFFATYSAFLGYMPGFVETESGYSPGSSENGTFPPMTLATWASFNQELYSRLNPAHAKATPGQVICQDYWIEGTDGSGVWRIDAAFINWLEDNQPPDEPLWGKAIRTMGINWDRKVLVSGGTTPPPPVPVPPTGGFMIDRRYMGRAGIGENYEPRPVGVGVDGVILHHTGGGFSGSLNHLTSATSGVGAHYLINDDGAIYQLVEDMYAAWHAGYSILNGREDCNRYTLGVEIVNAGDGVDTYPQVQQDALVWLLKEKAREHQIPRIWMDTHQKVRANYKARYPNATNPDGTPISHKTDPRGLDVPAILNRVYGVPETPVPPPLAYTDEERAKSKWYVEQLARTLRGDPDATATLISALISEPKKAGLHNVLVEKALPSLERA